MLVVVTVVLVVVVVDVVFFSVIKLQLILHNELRQDSNSLEEGV